MPALGVGVDRVGLCQPYWPVVPAERRAISLPIFRKAGAFGGAFLKRSLKVFGRPFL